MKVQLNHPGRQKPFKLGKGYIEIGNQIVREWNNDKVHYRKFIQINGYYINDLNDTMPKYTTLYFWGEWEGNSFFTPFPKNERKQKVDYRRFPNGVHKPFHSTVIRGVHNTDPYVYGKDFKYCGCKQKGQLTRLKPDDLILFGTVVPSLNKFYIDTVFVVKNGNPSESIQKTGGMNYSQVYREEVLEQINEYLKQPTIKNNNKVYHSKTYWDDSNYFSFVPCKLSCGNAGFERLFIELNNPTFQLSKYPTGKSFLRNCPLSPQDLWKEVVVACTEQGFVLGIQFDEPTFNNTLDDLDYKK